MYFFRLSDLEGAGLTMMMMVMIMMMMMMVMLIDDASHTNDCDVQQPG